MFDGPRVDASYDPMRKQGAIVLGNGGDNSNGSQGTFYEGVMTTGYPSDATDQAVQANVVAAKYSMQQLSLSPASATATPPGLQTFATGSSQDSTLKFTNTSGSRALGVQLSLSLPKGWKAKASGKTVFPSVKPGESVSTTFKVTSGPAAFNGDLVGNATWTIEGSSQAHSVTTTEQVRNTQPIKINEFRTRTSTNSTDQFIELSNPGASAVDISNWTLTEHPTQQAVSSTVTIPSGTTLPAGGHYVLGLSSSGLAAPARSGDATINVRSTSGLTAGDQINIDTGSGVETRTIASVGHGGHREHDALAARSRWSGHDPGRLDQRPGGKHLWLHGWPENGYRLRRQGRGGDGHRRRKAGSASPTLGGRLRWGDHHQGFVHHQHLGR